MLINPIILISYALGRMSLLVRFNRSINRYIPPGRAFLGPCIESRDIGDIRHEESCEEKYRNELFHKVCNKSVDYTQ